jgi:predicted TIM-barrel fold metal-dependent hydrolase
MLRCIGARAARLATPEEDSMTERIGAIDAWASPMLPGRSRRLPEEYRHIFRLYGSLELLDREIGPEEMLAEMDAADVEHAMLSAFGYQGLELATNEDVAELVAKYPDRFTGVGTVDPRGKPMDVVREIEHMAKDLGLRALRLEPYAYGDGMVGAPPNQKMYWPVYTKCVELGLAVCIQVGHTGPLLPSEAGRPIYLDEVALAFPELVLIGCHLGQPWHEEMMILAWKHPNVYVETSARTPKRWPRSFVQFASGWGQDKVLWGTDYPLLTFERTLSELRDLDLPETAYRKIVRENAIRAFRLEV